MSLASAHSLTASALAPSVPLPSVPPPVATPSAQPSDPPTPLQVFSAIFDIATIVLVSIMERIHLHSLSQSFNLFHKASICLYRITAVQVTLIRAPERITMAELRRLAKAARFINRLAGRELNFSALTGSADDSSAPASPHNPQSAIRNPQSPIPHSAFRIRHLHSPRCVAILSHPGATLARIFEQLVALDSRLPADPALPSSTTLPPAPAPTPTSSIASSSPGSSAFGAPVPAPSNPERPAPVDNPQPAPQKQLPSPFATLPVSSALRAQFAASPFPPPLPRPIHTRHHPPP